MHIFENYYETSPCSQLSGASIASASQVRASATLLLPTKEN
jgi:hypothetical protein